MRKKNLSSDFFNIIIYVLTIILGVLIAYSLITQYKIINNDITNVFNSKKYKQLHIDKVLSVRYSSSNLSDLSDIKNSDIVYEHYDNYSNKVKYEALFFDNLNIPIDNTIESISEIPITEYSLINYSSNSFIFNDMLDESCDVIHINYSPDIFSTFVYENGKYKFFSSNTESSYYNTDLYYSNIVIQIVDSTTYMSDAKNIYGKGTGLLFYNRKVESVLFENSVLYTKDNNLINLSPGKIFWIICTPDNSIVYDDTSHD